MDVSLDLSVFLCPCLDKAGGVFIFSCMYVCLFFCHQTLTLAVKSELLDIKTSYLVCELLG